MEQKGSKVWDCMYCVDTSVFIESWVRHYPIDIFPTLWDRFAEMIEKGNFVSPDEVQVEINKKDDGLAEWVKQHSKLFYLLDGPLQNATSEVMADFALLVDSAKGRSQADPFVIALAKINGGIVITEERNSGTLEKPKIPFVCNHYGITCINTIELIRRENWLF